MANVFLLIFNLSILQSVSCYYIINREYIFLCYHNQTRAIMSMTIGINFQLCCMYIIMYVITVYGNSDYFQMICTIVLN